MRTPHFTSFFFTFVALTIPACCFVLLQEQAASAAPAVVGLWRFNEGSGTNVADSSGLGNNGTLTGESNNVPAWVTGQAGFGGALKFTNDGFNHAYVDIPGAASLMIGQTATNPWSMTVWAYEDSNGTTNFVASYGRFLVTDDGTAFQFESGASGDGQIYTWSRANLPWQIGWGSASAVAPLLDQWVHWAVVYDGTNLTIYRNANQGPHGGTVSMPVTSPLAYPDYAGAVHIGSELGQPAAATWNGMLDDVAIFAGALTQPQVATVMSGDFSAFLGGPPGIVTQPTGQTVTFGSTVSFGVGAYGQAPFQYQWYFNGTNKLSGAANPTATNATLVLANVQFSQAGGYSVVISNSLNSVTSHVATLNVVFNSSLVGLWRFNEASGTNILDSSGLANNGYFTGESTNIPTRVPGQAGFGGALRFKNDGANHAYVVIPSSPPLAIGQTATNPWTITAWAYENSNGAGDFVATYGRIFVIDDGTAFQWESGASGDGEMYSWSRANTPWQNGWGIGNTVSPLLDQWEHWALVYDGTNLTVYRDGNSGANGGMASLALTTPSPLGGYGGYQDAIIIGSELAQDGTRNWDGMLDDIAVFNIPLSQTQIQTVMSGDFSAFVPRPPLSIRANAPNMILGWSANQPTFQLQSRTNLTQGSWANVSTPPVQNGGMLEVTVPTSSGGQFFRLVGP
jgi:hypothetical protein